MPDSPLRSSALVGVALFVFLGDAGVRSQQAESPRNEVAGPLRVLSDDGGWCWFEGERALVCGGSLLVGTVAAGNADGARKGNVNLLVHDLKSGETETVVLHERLECDDHDSPGLLELSDGRLLAMYSKHGSDDEIRYRIGSKAGDFTSFGAERTLAGKTAGRGVTYSNVYRLAEENDGEGNVYNFYRGAGWNPWFVRSGDHGKTWSEPVAFLEGEGRPYLRYATDGRGLVHFLATEQHPRNFDTSIRHGMLRAGRVYGSKSNFLSKLDKGPVPVGALDVVFQGSPDSVAWCSDIRLDAGGNPVAVYSVQRGGAGKPVGQGGEDLRYRYARFDGEGWVDRALAFAGTRLYAGEDDYSGLVTLHPQDVNTVFLSTNADPVTGKPVHSAADGKRHYEIYRGQTEDGGATWTFAAITRNSSVDNLRPVVAASTDGNGALLWMRGSYRTYQDFNTEVVGIRLVGDELVALQPAGHPVEKTIQRTFAADRTMLAIRRAATHVAQWQMTHEARYAKTDWTQAAYTVGLVHWAETIRNVKLTDWLRKRFEAMECNLGPRRFMADDYCIGYAYERFAWYHKEPALAVPTIARMHEIAAKPNDESLEWKGGIWDREWAWCDALFMGPPTMAWSAALTGDLETLQCADRLWWKTAKYLYDEEHHLFYRDGRFLDRKESNGKPVFWSRGNGWVVGGLVRVLEVLPDDHPSRPRYVAMLVEMLEALRPLQGANGAWPSSLLDPPKPITPETSGTAFFTYAIAWAVNHNLLDRDSWDPVLERAWSSLTSAIHPNGKLGYVQRQADAPGAAGVDETEVYAVGGFLLAASELHKMARMDGMTQLPMTLTNSGAKVAYREHVAVDWSEVVATRPSKAHQFLRLRDVRSGAWLPHEALDTDRDGSADLLHVEVFALPRESRVVELMWVKPDGPFNPGPLRQQSTGTANPELELRLDS